MALLSPAFLTAVVIAEIDECGARTSHELPPLKSMPRLNPRIPSDPSEHDDDHARS